MHTLRRPWRPADGLWLTAMILGFTWWWPVGLALLFLWKRGEFMSCRSSAWMAPWRDRARAAVEGALPRAATGNLAFDAHRDAVLRRLEAERAALEEERRAFGDFLDQLRRAKDQEEFDRFMAARGKRAEGRVA